MIKCHDEGPRAKPGAPEPPSGRKGLDAEGPMTSRETAPPGAAAGHTSPIRGVIAALLDAFADRLDAEQEAATTLANLSAEIGEKVNSIFTTSMRIREQVELACDGIAGTQLQIGRLEEALTAIAARQRASDYNLEQVRSLSEAAAHRIEELTTESVNRDVRDPLLREIVRTLSRIESLATNGTVGADWKAELTALAAEIVRFVDTQGITVVRPQAGARFDPRMHQALKRTSTPDPGLHLQVERVFAPAVLRGEALVQPGRVTVFTYEPQPNDQKASGGASA